MANIVFNPPPGWSVVPKGWVPGTSWQPPLEWPPIPPGWPLFVTVRTWPRSVASVLFLVGGCLGYAALMERAGTPLPPQSIGLVAVVLLVGWVTSFVRTTIPTPVKHWPWMPSAHAVGVRPLRDELEPESWRLQPPASG